MTILERTVPASHESSSHGSARIFRYAYPDEFYTRAVIESKGMWDELDRASGLELITPSGAVDYGPERQPERLAGVLAGLGVEHELLSAGEAREKRIISQSTTASGGRRRGRAGRTSPSTRRCSGTPAPG